MKFMNILSKISTYTISDVQALEKDFIPEGLNMRYCLCSNTRRTLKL